MSAADVKFLLATVKAIAVAGRIYVRPKVRSGVGRGFGSRHLAKNLEIRSGTGGNIAKDEVASRIYLPHYWAIYVHDGRGPIFKEHLMIWYKDRRQDPRLRTTGGYPKRKRQVAKFRKGELARDIKAGKIGGMAHSVGPVAPSKFFSNRSGMRGFKKDIVVPLVTARWKKHIASRIKSIKDLRGLITIPIG